jgi:hypothetical protein
MPKKAKEQQRGRKQETSQIKTYILSIAHPTNGEGAQSSQQYVFRRLSASLSCHVVTPSSSSQAQRFRVSPRRFPSATEYRGTRGRTALGSRNGKHGKPRE